MCYKFIYSFTYCTLHVGLLDILHLHHMCHTCIYIAVTSYVLQIHSFIHLLYIACGTLEHSSFSSHVPHIHLYSSHITCATNSFIHSDRHMCYAYINSCSHITCATHSFIHSVTHTRSTFLLKNMSVITSQVRVHLFQESLVSKTRTPENFKPLKIQNHFPFMQYIREYTHTRALNLHWKHCYIKIRGYFSHWSTCWGWEGGES